MPGLIVHEWISEHGGSENVAEAMVESWPDAEVLCLWNDAPHRFQGRRVLESWLARTPLRKSKLAAVPFMPATWAAVDVRGYDFVLVSSHLFAHHVGGRVRHSGPQKFVYVHTPARYLWAPELDERGNSALAKMASPLLKRVDAARAQSGAMFAANSEFVRDRVRNAWGQDAEVIYPPVRVSQLQSVPQWRDALSPSDEAVFDSLPDEFLLGASRFVPYKRLDVVIRAGEATGMPVVLAGSGPLRGALAEAGEAANIPVIIVDKPSNALLYALYQAAQAFVFPAIEDFGIMPVEAMSLGTPAVVTLVGGAQESVRLLAGGAVLESFSSSDLSRAVESALSLDMGSVPSASRALFDGAHFGGRLDRWMSGQRDC